MQGPPQERIPRRAGVKNDALMGVDKAHFLDDIEYPDAMRASTNEEFQAGRRTGNSACARLGHSAHLARPSSASRVRIESDRQLRLARRG